MTDFTILRVVSKILIPYILLFGFYVQFHGDYGPGGGFQAGVIAGAALVLYGIVFGLRRMREAVPPVVVERFVAAGVVLFAAVGVASLVLGGNFLDYNVFNSHHPAHGQHVGILLIELGVGITVAAVTVTIFENFAGRGS